MKTRLRALQTAARFAPGAHRILAESGSVNPLAAMIREIDETLLGRSLMFSTDTGNSLSLDVAGRRVLRVTAATGVEGADRCLGVKALEDANREDLARLLSGLARPGCELRVQTVPLGKGGEGLSVGLPVARLAHFLDIDLNADASEVPAEPVLTEGFLQSFIAGVGGALIAWLLRSETEEIGRSGEEEMLAHLEDFLIDEFSALAGQLDKISSKPDDPVCTVLGADLLAGHSIVCARANGAVLLGVVAGEAALHVLVAWNAARG